MNLIEWQDENGLKHLSWLRDQDPPDQAAALGIPHDPPDLSSLGLTAGQEQTLHNLLVEHRLIVWRNATDFKGKLTDVGTVAGLEGEQINRLARLYSHGQPPSRELPFDLEAALDALPVEEYQRRCLRDAFTRAGIRDLTGLENAPMSVGHVCGLDIYQVIARLTGK